MNTLLMALFLGLAAAAAATIVRALVPTLWLLIKPFSCDLCMSWWSSLALGLMAYSDISYPIHVLLVATTTSMFTLKVLNRLSDIKLE